MAARTIHCHIPALFVVAIACWTLHAQQATGPRLAVSLAPNQREIRIAWPGATADYLLEEAPAPTGAWQPVAQPPQVSNGQFVVTLPPTPAARFFRLRRAAAVASDFYVLQHTPAHGADEVGVTFRPQIVFSKPVNPGTLSTNNIFATAAGKTLPATVVPATDGSFAWLFFREHMPGSTRVRVTVDGSSIGAKPGNTLLDADRDGRPGGFFHFEFTTVSRTDLAGTSLTGIVVDPGPDLVPRSADDLDPGPDGRQGTLDDIYRLPIEGVRVFVIGQETNTVVTGRDGRFRLPAVPAGNVKVVVDGNRATQPPPGLYFPEMVLDAQMIVGKENWTMTNGAEVYLPRVARSILQTVTGTNVNTVKATAEGALGLSAFQRNQLTIEIPPNSLVGTNGQVLASGQVGISTVPQDLVRDMLPPGVLQHTFDITVQAPGVATLARPAPMTFPNVFNQPPGTKLNFLSFDHTTGRLVIEGTATVSEDGATVRTDPGTGITHPGWHGLTPPGGPNDPPEPPDPDCEPELIGADAPGDDPAGAPGLHGTSDRSAGLHADVAPAETEGLENAFFTKDGESFTMRFKHNGARPANPSPELCGPGSTGPKPIVVKLSITGNNGPDRFLEGIDASLARPFLLRPGQEKKIKVTLTPLLKKIRKVEMDRLYGAKITAHAWELGAIDRPLLINRTFHIGRYLDAADADHTDGILSLSPTATGQGGIKGVIRTREHEVRGVPLRLRLADGQQDKPFFTLFQDVNFSPKGRGDAQTADLEIISPGNEVIGRMKAEGEARLQEFFVDRVKIREVLARAAGGGIEGVTAEQRAFLNADGALDRILDRTLRDVDALLEPYAAGITRIPAKSAVGIDITVFDSADVSPPLTEKEAKTLGRSGQTDFCSVESGLCLDNFTTGTPPQHPIIELIQLAPKVSQAEAAYRLSASLNRTSADTFQIYVDHFLTARRLNGIPYVLTEDKLVTELTVTIVHEIGHTLGLVHTFNAELARQTKGCGCALLPNGNPPPDYREDIMAQGEKLGPLLFTVSGSAYQIALGLNFTAAEGMRAINYFAANHRGARKARTSTPLRAFDNAFEGSDDRPLIGEAEMPGSLVLFASSAEEGITGTHDFGKVPVDGAGGKFAEQAFELVNVGDTPVTIQSTSLAGEGLDGFDLTTVAAGTTIPGNSSVPIIVRFDPLTSGAASATLQLDNDGEEGAIEMDVTGFGLSPHGDIRLLVENNNLGGATLGGPAKLAKAFGTITNIGASELVITGINATDERGFSVPASALPAGFSAANPVRLPAGRAMTFDLAFRPSQAGLLRGQVRVVSNDPDSPTTTTTVVGTGLSAGGPSLEYGNDFAAMESPDFPNGPVLRARTDSAGRFEFFLPPDQRYHAAIFDPVSGMIAHLLGTTAPSGRNTELGVPVFLPSRAPDSDGDGLPDDIEFAVGSNPNAADTDKNGLDDFVEVVQGRNPLGDQLAVTGIVGRAAASQARSITLVSPLTGNPDVLHAYVANGEMLVLDVSRPTLPTTIASLRVPGSVQDIAVDPATQVAVLAGDINRATTSTGLFLVDISAPASPQLLRSFGFPALHVEAFNGHAYAVAPAFGASSALRSFDLVTRESGGELVLPLRSIDSVVREANHLYILGESKLVIVSVDGINLALRGTLPVPFAAGRMAVAGGIAYLPFAGNGIEVPGGYSTVDVSNPDQPRIIQLSQAPRGVATPGAIVQVNGSGLVLLAGAAGVANPWVLDVMNAASPTNTYSFVTRFPLGRALPIDVAVGGGLAFVAAHSDGVLVMNYLPLDTKGEAPRFQNVEAMPDSDPSTPGVQLIEGRDFHVRVGLLEDVQVRAVELLVDGMAVQRSVSFPWNLAGVAPARGAQKTTVTIQVRATDTGGNVALSAPFIADLVFDPTAATLVGTDPAPGESKGRGLRQARFTFSKPMGRAAAEVQGYELRGAAGETISITSAALRDGDRVVELTFDRLEAGAYQLVARSALIKDRAGKALGGADVVRNFTVDPYSIRWINATGQPADWFQATNWFPRRVPGEEDTVLIDLPSTNAPVAITAPVEWQREGIRLPVKVRSLDSTEPLALAWVEFAATERMRVSSNTVFGFSAALKDTRWIGTDVCFVVGDFLLNGVTMEGNFEASERGYRFFNFTGAGARIDLRESFALNGTLTNANAGNGSGGSIIIPYGLALEGTGTLHNATLSAGAQSSISEREPYQEEFTIGSGLVLRGIQTIGVSGKDNRLINRGTILLDVPYAPAAFGPRSTLFLGGPTTTTEIVNLGTIEVRNGAFLQIDGAFTDRFINRGTLRATDRGFLKVNAHIVSDRIVCDAGATCDFNGVLIGEPGTVSEFSGPGQWFVSQSSQLAGSARVPARLLPVTNATPPSGAQPVVRLVNGASLEGSTTFNDVVFEGDLHNYDYNVRQSQIPRQLRGYGTDVVVRTNLTLNGTITFHRQGSDTQPGRLLWAGGQHQLNGKGRVTFEAAAFPGQFGGGGAHVTIGPDITVIADGVTFGNQFRDSNFPFSYIRNQGTILAERAGSTVQFYSLVVTNAGMIKIGSGVIVTNHHGFAQTATGSVVVMAAGGQPGVSHGQLRILGESFLDGGLVVEPVGAFQPTGGDSFEWVTYRTRQGTFARLLTPPPPAGLAWLPEYGPSSFRLRLGAPVAASRQAGAAGGHPGRMIPAHRTSAATQMPHTASQNAFPLTILAWVKTAQVAPVLDGIVCKYVADSGNGYSLLLHEGRLRAWYFKDPSHAVWGGGLGLDGGFLADDRWHHVAFVVDEHGGVLYVDGAPTASEPWSGPDPRVDAGPGPCSSTAPLLLGRFDGSSSGFSGAIGEISLWQTALHEPDILLHSRGDSMASDDPSIIGRWRLSLETEGAGVKADLRTAEGNPVAPQDDATAPGRRE